MGKQPCGCSGEPAETFAAPQVQYEIEGGDGTRFGRLAEARRAAPDGARIVPVQEAVAAGV